MSNFKDKIFSSRIGQIGVLIFSAYTGIWALVEPWGIDWIDDNKQTWRLILIISSGVIALLLGIRLSKSILEQFSPDGLVKTLQGSFSTSGSPNVTIEQDGILGNVVNIKGDFHSDELDWIIKSSAQRAKKVEVVFKHNGEFVFYLRVGMISKNGETSIERWIRFDSKLTTADPFVQNTPELGVPFSSTSVGSFDKAIINISNAVKQSYGQDGWVYNKVFLFRIRCVDATLKNILFKK